jgi:hypothetical protein
MKTPWFYPEIRAFIEREGLTSTCVLSDIVTLEGMDYQHWTVKISGGEVNGGFTFYMPPAYFGVEPPLDWVLHSVARQCDLFERISAGSSWQALVDDGVIERLPVQNEWLGMIWERINLWEILGALKYYELLDLAELSSPKYEWEVE